MRPLYVFLFFGLVLSILFSSGQIENPDTHLRLTQTRIILDDNKFGLPDDVGEDSHGNISINKDGKGLWFTIQAKQLFSSQYIILQILSQQMKQILIIFQHSVYLF